MLPRNKPGLTLGLAALLMAFALALAPAVGIGQENDEPADPPVAGEDAGDGEAEAGDEGEAGDAGDTGEGEGDAGGEGEGEGEGETEEQPDEPADDLVFEPTRVELAFDEALKPITFEAGSRKGWAVKLPEGLPLATPAVAHGRVYVGAGYGSYAFYAFDAKTGEVSWKFQCGDDGPTAAVVWDKYVAYNTESCTLYVHNAVTGEKLWERWLGDPLMNMPTIADGKIYMVYPKGGHGGFGGFGNAPQQGFGMNEAEQWRMVIELNNALKAEALAKKEEIRSRLAQADVTAEEAAELKAQLEELDKMIMSAEEQINAAEARIAELETQQQQMLPDMRAQLEAAIVQFEAEIKSLSLEIAMVRDQLATAGLSQEAAAELNEKLAALEAQVVAYEQQIAAARTKLEALETVPQQDSDDDGEADGDEAPVDPMPEEPLDPNDPQPEQPERWLSHSLIAMDITNGETIWEKSIDGDAISAPIISEGALYLTTFSGTMYCFGIHDGELRWERAQQVTSAPWVHRGTIYAAQREAREAYTTADGSTANRQYEGVTKWSAQAGEQQQQMNKEQADYLSAVERAQSAMQQLQQDLDAGVGFGGGAPEGANLRAAEDNLGINTVAGGWAFQGSRPVVVGNLMFNAQGNMLQARVASSGTALWRKRVHADTIDDATASLMPPAVVAGRLYVATLAGDVMCVDGMTGDVLWCVNIGHEIVYQPAVQDGHVFVGTIDGIVVAIDCQDPAATGWNMWGGGPAHNGIEK